ncbi:MAG: Ig-like domain-containing protein, partial [Planctomycetota bacterium]
DNLSTVQLTVGNGTLNVTLSGTASISAGANNSGDLTLSGSLADINATLSSLIYQGNQHFNGSDTLTVLFTDSDSATDTDTVTITVDAVNDTPDVVGPGSAYTVNEQTNLNIHGTGFSVTDVDAASGTMTATITVGEGTINLAAGNSGVSITANNAGTVTFTGTLTQINNLLTGGGTGSIVYNNGSDTPSASTTITVTVNDGGNTGSDPGLTGDSSSEVDSASQTINVTAVNDDPLDSGAGLPSDVTVVEDVLTGVDLSAINFSDVDASGSDLTVTLSTSTGGQLTLQADASIDFGGSATARTLTGTLAELNAYFNNTSNVSYLHPTSNLNGNHADTITVVINDNDNSGIGGGGDQALGVVNVDIGAINDAPVNSVPGTQSVAEETPTAISGLSIGDVDAGSGNLSTRLQVSAGVLNVTLSGSATISGGSNGSGDLTIQGTVTDINSTLATLIYTGNTDVVGTAADTLTMTTNDLGNTGTGGPLVDSDSIQIDITGVNDTPDIVAPGSAFTVNEQTNLNLHGTGFSVSDVDAGSGIMTASFSVGEGMISLSAGDSGITIVFNNGPTVSFAGTLSQINDLLTGTSTGTIVYNNPSDTPSASTTVTLTVNDGGNTGVDPGLTGDGTSEQNSASQTINVTAVNDAPAIGGGPDSVGIVQTNVGLSISGTLTVSDPDVNDTVLASVDSVSIGGSGAGKLPTSLDTATLQSFLSVSPAVVLDPTQTSATLTWNFHSGGESFDFLAAGETLVLTYTITAVDDGVGTLGDSETVTITITGTNDLATNEGTFPADINTVEDVITDVDLSQMDLADVDIGTANLTLTLQTSTGGELFATSGGGVTVAGSGTDQLTVLGTLADLNAFLNDTTRVQYLHSVVHTNGDNADTLTVTINDGGGDVVLGTANVDIGANNDAPVIVSDGGGATATVTIQENSTLATTVMATDVDLPVQTLTYRIAGGADAALFQIDSSGGQLMFSNAPNFELPGDVDGDNQYEVIVEVTDGGFIDSQAITVRVTDQNEAPIGSGESYATLAGSPLVGGGGALLANDTDPDGDALIAILATPPASGTVVVNPDGSFVYTPDSGHFGVDQFTYVAQDPGGLQSSVVTVNVTTQAGDGTGGNGDDGSGDNSNNDDSNSDDSNNGDSNNEDSNGDDTNSSDDDSGANDSFDQDASSGSDATTGPLPGGRDTMSAGDAESASLGGVITDLSESGLGDVGDQDLAVGFGEGASWNTGLARLDEVSPLLLASLGAGDLGPILLDELAAAQIVWHMASDSETDEFGDARFFRGEASVAAASLFSIGVMIWLFRGGAVVTALASSSGSWRLVDPTAMLTAAKIETDQVDQMLKSSPR